MRMSRGHSPSVAPFFSARGHANHAGVFWVCKCNRNRLAGVHLRNGVWYICISGISYSPNPFSPCGGALIISSMFSGWPRQIPACDWLFAGLSPGGPCIWRTVGPDACRFGGRYCRWTDFSSRTPTHTHTHTFKHVCVYIHSHSHTHSRAHGNTHPCMVGCTHWRGQMQSSPFCFLCCAPPLQQRLHIPSLCGHAVLFWISLGTVSCGSGLFVAMPWMLSARGPAVGSASTRTTVCASLDARRVGSITPDSWTIKRTFPLLCSFSIWVLCCPCCRRVQILSAYVHPPCMLFLLCDCSLGVGVQETKTSCSQWWSSLRTDSAVNIRRPDVTLALVFWALQQCILMLVLNYNTSLFAAIDLDTDKNGYVMAGVTSCCCVPQSHCRPRRRCDFLAAHLFTFVRIYSCFHFSPPSLFPPSLLPFVLICR